MWWNEITVHENETIIQITLKNTRVIFSPALDRTFKKKLFKFILISWVIRKKWKLHNPLIRKSMK